MGRWRPTLAAMAIEVRTITDGEVGAWDDAMRVGFLTHPTEGAAEARRPDLELGRCWAAFDGPRVVATLRTFATDLTVPGGEAVPTAALTNVTVTSTHRRRGLLTRMIEPDLRNARERGEPLGALIASEYPIYGRFGYGPAVEHATYTVAARRVTFLDPPSGVVELVDTGTFRKEAPAVFERHRARQVGELRRTDRFWDKWLGLVPTPGWEHKPMFQALVLDGDGNPSGYVAYRTDETWDQRVANVTLDVLELVAVDDEAEARLWAYCCSVDWVTTVKAADRSVADPLPWRLVDARAARLAERNDFVWVRVLDTPVALTARRYLTGGSVVLEVVDRLGLAGGRYLLDGGPDGATCAPTTRAPGLTVPVDVLGAAYLGGHTLGTLAAAGRLDVHDAAALATADAMFRSPVVPWCTTWF
jgi:predicted acetyltransferase